MFELRKGDAPMTVDALAALADVVTQGDPGCFLSPEENAKYDRCKQSVIDARRSAERIEGQLWIG